MVVLGLALGIGTALALSRMLKALLFSRCDECKAR
jgi:hypothetical protein